MLYSTHESVKRPSLRLPSRPTASTLESSSTTPRSGARQPAHLYSQLPSEWRPHTARLYSRQKERDDEQQAAFDRALQSMDLLYAHQETMVWRMTRLLDGYAGAKPYSERGWVRKPPPPLTSPQLATVCVIPNERSHASVLPPWPIPGTLSVHAGSKVCSHLPPRGLLGAF